jgi:hypothetical protein
LTFNGFPKEGLDALARLRDDPNIKRYHAEKPLLDRAIVTPFKRYRDDLVVNWVLPNGLLFETERNVFSRILKNDFGAGGSHHHLWLAFYRPHRTRLTDLQLSHGVYPHGFRHGLFLGDRARRLFEPARRRLFEEPETALGLLNGLLDECFDVTFAAGSGPQIMHTDRLDQLPAGLAKATSLWVSRLTTRDDMQRLGPALVERAIQTMDVLWPLYRFFAEAEEAPA